MTGIDIWRIDVAEPEAEPAGPGGRLAPLNAEELARAARYIRDVDRHAFIGARSALRDILSRYVGRPATSVSFETATWGKPHLRDADGWFFNLSHSGSKAAIAVSRRGEVGVDIELVRPISVDAISDYFTPEELQRIKHAVDPTPELYAHWTMKEAYLKALGTGLRTDLSTFSVCPGARGQIGGYSVTNLDLFDGFAAAVAIEAEPGEEPAEICVRDLRLPVGSNSGQPQRQTIE